MLPITCEGANTNSPAQSLRTLYGTFDVFGKRSPHGAGESLPQGSRRTAWASAWNLPGTSLRPFSDVDQSVHERITHYAFESALDLQTGIFRTATPGLPTGPSETIDVKRRIGLPG